jgi:pantoate--beta-alanine ligase
MKVVTSVVAMQRMAQAWKRKGTQIGFVPTMGFLHDGHLSLIQRARRSVGKKGVVVVSIYVNPTQFAPTEDLARYPRDLPRDKALCKKAGTDVLFVPEDSDIYAGRKEGNYTTYVVEEKLSKGMEGSSRPTHFRGVTTIVAKLFNIVLPDVAVFGAKDFQQAAVVQKMVRDLNFPLKIVVAPTVREADGLAMSSRNKYLEGPLRKEALALWQAIQAAKGTVKTSGQPVQAAWLKEQLRQFIQQQPNAKVDYIEFFDTNTLQPSTVVQKGTHMALAVSVGKTRLIDNAQL